MRRGADRLDRASPRCHTRPRRPTDHRAQQRHDADDGQSVPGVGEHVARYLQEELGRETRPARRAAGAAAACEMLSRKTAPSWSWARIVIGSRDIERRAIAPQWLRRGETDRPEDDVADDREEREVLFRLTDMLKPPVSLAHRDPLAAHGYAGCCRRRVLLTPTILSMIIRLKIRRCGLQ